MTLFLTCREQRQHNPLKSHSQPSTEEKRPWVEGLQVPAGKLKGQSTRKENSSQGNSESSPELAEGCGDTNVGEVEVEEGKDDSSRQQRQGNVGYAMADMRVNVVQKYLMKTAEGTTGTNKA